MNRLHPVPRTLPRWHGAAHALRLVWPLAVAVLLTACANTLAPHNAPTQRVDAQSGYRPQHFARTHQIDGLALSMSFSGGGTRAAALSYGVLEELARTHVQVGERRLRMLDLVDSISAVSGGSYTAAYYGLFGERVFEDFEPRFLKRDVQRDIARAIVSPGNLFRLTSPYFGRTDVAAEYLDAQLFEGRTFADMARSVGTGGQPFVLINATDMARISRFEFTQDQFDLLCSDLGRMPVARAVAASSAVPVIFSPLTLSNYAGHCGHMLPAWVQNAAADPATSRRRHALASDVLSYTDSHTRRYIHLLDGGLADNLGARAFLDRFDLGGVDYVQRHAGRGDATRIAHIVVNAQTRPSAAKLDQSPQVPTLGAIVFAVSNITDRYTVETLEHLRLSMDQGVQALRAQRRRAGVANADDVQGWVIEVSFDLLPDAEERAYFQNLPTSFRLPEQDVDRLRAVGARLLRESPAYQSLLQSLEQTKPQAKP